MTHTTQYDDLIQAAHLQYLTDPLLPGTDWRLLKAQLIQESNLQPDAVSPAGAQAIAQFMPPTWADRAPAGASPFDPEIAIPMAASYMEDLLRQWRADRTEMDRYCLALASYNAGLGSILRAQRAAGGANDYRTIIGALPQVTGRHAAETQGYALKILRKYAGLQCDG